MKCGAEAGWCGWKSHEGLVKVVAKLELVVLIVLLTTVGNKIVLSWISIVTLCYMAVV